MTKLLFISNIAGKRVNNFSMSSILAAKKLGFDFHIAANWNKSTPEQMKVDQEKYGITLHHINFKRNPFNLANYEAYKQLLILMKNEKFDVVHCNTPIGGIMGRICSKQAGINSVIYMAHGFHFYRGAPLVNNTLFRWVELLLAHLTDVLITINKDDYEVGKKFKLRNNGKVYYVPGVGLDTSKFKSLNVDRFKKRDEIGISQDAIMLLSVGELNSNKNHEVVIRAIAGIDKPNIHYCIAGEGPLHKYLCDIAESLNIRNRIHLLGFRNDVGELYKAADIFLFPTIREGLGLSALEAMSSGLPIITSNVRGIIDYSVDGVTGFTCHPKDVGAFSEAINILSNNSELRTNIGKHNMVAVSKYDIENVITTIKKIYIDTLAK